MNIYMRNGCRGPRAKSHAYLVPFTVYEALNQTRDYLRLLAQLTEPQSEVNSDVIYLSAQALAHCFVRFADDLDRIAEAIDPVEP